MDLKARAKQLKTDIPAVFLALKKRETPWTAKALAALTVGYALSPIDLIPDFIPVLGLLDDALIVPLGVWLFRRMVSAALYDQYRAEAETAAERPTSWAGAAIVLALWALAAWAIWDVARWAYD